MLEYVSPIYVWNKIQQEILQNEQQTALVIMHYLLPLANHQIQSKYHAKIDGFKAEIQTFLVEGRIEVSQTATYLLQNKPNEMLQLYVFVIQSIPEQESLEAILLNNQLQELVDKILLNENVLQKNTAYIYLLIFGHQYLTLIDKILNKTMKYFFGLYSKKVKRTDYLCLKISIKDSLDFYNNSEDFFKLALQQPISLLNNFLRISSSSFFQQIPLSHLIESTQCILSTPIASRHLFKQIKLPNCGYIVNIKSFIHEKVYSNNHFVRLVEALNVYDILLGSNNLKILQKEEHYKQFCLTIIPNEKHEKILFNFFDGFPPEIKNLSNWDILSYQQNAYLPAFRYKIATEGYWEQCPQSQFIEIFYLCNDSEIEWLSIPAEAYHQAQHKIDYWSIEQIEQICYNSCAGYFHTIQKQGQVVIIGSGNQHFWRVRSKLGTAVLLSWSTLLKNNMQIKKYLDITLKKQKQKSLSWKLDIQHRQLIMNYLSHELSCISSKDTRRRLASFVQEGVLRQYKLFLQNCFKYNKRGELKQQNLDIAFRLCGNCGVELLNIFVILQQNIFCSECLAQQLKKNKQTQKITFGYMVKPDILDTFLSFTSKVDILDPTNNKSIRTFNYEYETNFCKRKFRGCFDISMCRGDSHRQFESRFTSHLGFIHDFETIQLHLLLQRAYYVPVEKQIKMLALLPCGKDAKSKQIGQYLQIASKCVLERRQLSKQMSFFYENSNFVLHTLNCLSDYVHACD